MKKIFLRIFNSLKATLNQPFPESGNLTDQLKSAFGIALFIFLFLFIFKPFGLHRAGDQLMLYAFYFGAVTFGVSIVYDIILEQVLRLNREDESWTFGKWIVSVIVLICLIAAGNYVIMAMVLNAVALSFEAYLGILYSTLLVGIFPVIFFGSLAMNNARRRFERMADRFTITGEEDSGPGIEIQAEGESLALKRNAFIYAEAMQNYVAIYHDAGGMIEKDILRMPLRRLEKQIGGNHIRRCHRSFIVNISKIREVKGNAQGLKLSLKGVEYKVPVSRSYTDRFRTL